MKTPVDDYPVTIRPLDPEDGGGFLAEAPDLPGCMSDGVTETEALANVRDAIASWIEAAQEDGRFIPAPRTGERYSGRLLLRAPRSLHRRLAERAYAEGVSINTMTVTLIAEGLGKANAKSTARSRRAAS